MIHSFEPILGRNPSVLVLGSMPSVKSLEENQYYGHPRNQFWPIMARVLDFEMPLSHVKLNYSEKIALMKGHGISVWDVLKTCERKGSLDSDIKHEQPNDLGQFLGSQPSIKAIILNGGKAESTFKKFFKDIYKSNHYSIIKMPSTSPAHTMKMEKKLESWMAIRQFI